MSSFARRGPPQEPLSPCIFSPLFHGGNAMASAPVQSGTPRAGDPRPSRILQIVVRPDPCEPTGHRSASAPLGAGINGRRRSHGHHLSSAVRRGQPPRSRRRHRATMSAERVRPPSYDLAPAHRLGRRQPALTPGFPKDDGSGPLPVGPAPFGAGSYARRSLTQASGLRRTCGTRPLDRGAARESASYSRRLVTEYVELCATEVSELR